MAKHIWSVLCTRGVLDRYTNNVSLHDVVEEIAITPSRPMPDALGAFPASLSLVSLWVRSEADTPETVQTRMRLLAPDGTKVAEGSVVVDMTTHKRSRYFSHLTAMPFKGDGVYQFVVEQLVGDQDWREVASVPLEVTVTEPKNPSQAELSP